MIDGNEISINGRILVGKAVSVHGVEEKPYKELKSIGKLKSIEGIEYISVGEVCFFKKRETDNSKLVERLV
tara:strand:- start:5 stop:217 length:213 start_codon:yes stop_codon:yes gene_type:complete